MMMLLAKRLRDDNVIQTGWSSLPYPDLVEVMVRAGYEAVTLDMQHGAHHEGSVQASLPLVCLAGGAAIVRIPVGRNDMASRALDFGAEAVIAPMINSLDDAVAFARAMKYPPLGERSWGPARALALHGDDAPGYLKHANERTLSLAMIETRAAVEALDDILAVTGLDGVFVGPSDFSISLTDGATIDTELDEMMPLVAEIATKARARGKLAGIFAMNPKKVPDYVAMGYRLIANGIDTVCLAKGAASLREAAL